MNLFGLARRSLFFYRRTNIGVLLSVLVSSAVLTGALVIGDSVRYSLMMITEARLGKTQFALVPNERFFRAQLADELAAELNTDAAAVLQVRGLISNDTGSKIVNNIQVLGVDNKFYEVGTGQNPFLRTSEQTEQVVLNKPLAQRLDVQPGDEIVVRIEKPSLLPRDVPLTPDSDLSTAFRMMVGAIADKSEFGSFGLQANQVSSLNVFVPIEWLQKQIEQPGQANVLLLSGNENSGVTIERADDAISRRWGLEDAALEINELQNQNVFEIRSRRVFIEDSLAGPVRAASEDSVAILTYFVNELWFNDKATPYSMVAAMDFSTGRESIVPEDMSDDEIIINQWLADDLGVNVGDSVELRYYVLMPMRQLAEQSRSFRVREIVPMDGIAVDPELMPDFPGLSDADNCRDWDPGIPVDLDKIRESDEDYWDDYKGTPKAFVTLKAGQDMWANRYGGLTAVRFPMGTDDIDSITQRILQEINPASVGLFFQPVKEMGEKAGGQGTDFGQLFIGLSMFLIMAALILTGLLFVFGVENRSEQIGLLLAVGLPPKSVKRLLLLEGGLLAIIGAVLGTIAALLYTKIMIWALVATNWQSAVGQTNIEFYAKTTTLIFGASSATIVSLIAIWITLRGHLSLPARELLSGILRWQFFVSKPSSGEARTEQSTYLGNLLLLIKKNSGLWIAFLALFGAIILIVTMEPSGDQSNTGAFFAAGGLLLVAGLGFSHALLKIASLRWNRAIVSIVGLGLRNSTRRRGRSLAVIGLLACGIFLVISVGANKQSPLDDVQKRDSGTGGFALYGESTISILHDLNSNSGRESMRLDDATLEGVQIVQFRAHDGDDASCLNLNRVQAPRVLAVQPEQLQQRGAFEFSDVSHSWELLDNDIGEDIVPAIGDYSTVIWSLGKNLGDDIEYSDEQGRLFKLRIVGMLRNSIMQGGLIISENNFLERFPSDEGYRVFLIDADQDKTEIIEDMLGQRLRDFGLELTKTSDRLADFMAMQNTYLSIFQLLGGLGLVLGSIGLGLVVLRNVLERRSELAMLRAVGFDKTMIRKMLFDEHVGLMLGGLACGVISALVAVLPVLRTERAKIPYLTIAAIGLSAVIWIWLAASFALSDKIIDSLRNE